MLLPFVSILVKPFFCSIADRNRSHRKFFLFFLITALIGYGSFGILPFFLSPVTEKDGLIVSRWIIICIMTTTATLSMAVLTCLSDAFAVNSARANVGSTYGGIRVWGTIGWAISSLIIAFLNQNEYLPFLVPGLLLTIYAISFDIIINFLWLNKEDYDLKQSESGQNTDDIVNKINRIEVEGREESSLNQSYKIDANQSLASDESVNYGSTYARPIKISKEIVEFEPRISNIQLQFMLFNYVAKHRPSLFRYLVLFTISGALAALQWSYFFVYLEKIFNEKEFPFFSGLSMIGQSLLGELPFFILAQPLINFIGRTHALSISIATVGARYLMYAYILPTSGGYFVLVTEMFQGPNFGLFYVVLTSVGLDYSDCDDAILEIVQKKLVKNNPAEIEKLRNSLRSLMMAMASASYEGLGVGIGSLIGGFVIDFYSFEKLWLCSSVLAIVLGLLNSLIDISGITKLIGNSN